MKKVPLMVMSLGIGVVVLAVGFGWFLFPYLVRTKINKQMALVKGSETYERWQNIPVPIFMKVYLFNITNPDEVTKGLVPVLKEVGPYVYQQKRQKIVESVSGDGNRVFFRPKLTYYFRRDLSVGSEDDSYTFANIPLISTATTSGEKGTLARTLIADEAENFGETAFVHRTVGQYLFHGYKVDFVEELGRVNNATYLPNNTFGLYYGKNGTEGDLLEIYSGLEDTTKLGMTISWKGITVLDYWNDPYCNMINGSDGSIFPPFVTRDRRLRVFSPEMCRSLYMVYEEDTEILGVPGYKFVPPKEMLQDVRVYPENRCYCPNPGKDMEYCPKRGAFQMSTCRKGAPILASWPHFYDGDQEYQQKVKGLSPDRSKHETYIVLEPTTGSLIRAGKRFQINVDLKRNKFFKMLNKLPSVVLPVLWVDESAGMNEENAEMIQAKLFRPFKITNACVWSTISFGIVCILFSLLMNVRAENSEKIRVIDMPAYKPEVLK